MLPCRADGEPTPKIKWLKDGVLVHNMARFAIIQGGSLKIDGE